MQDIQILLENVASQCLGHAARRTGRAISNYFNDLLRPLDLNLPQYGLLVAIGRDPDRTLSAIADALGLDDTTLTRNLAILKRRGLVAAEGGRGRAGKRVRLTEAGVALTRRAVEIWAEANAAITAHMSEADLAAGRAFLQNLEAAALSARAQPVRRP